MIPDGHATHIAGNQLDQIFANFAVDVEQLPQGTVDSDHASFLITASITKEQHDVDLQHLPRQVRQQDVRALANDEATVQALLRQGSVLNLPTQDLYQDRLQARRRMVRWYEAPRHLPGREAPIKVGFDQTTIQSWQQTIKNLEEAYKRHDLKTFFGDVNRLCSLKPSSPIVVGLETPEGEVLYNRNVIDKTLADDFKAKQQLLGLSSLNLLS